MTDNATILIPDISGYTEFVTRTELDHSSHIINELLNLIINQNYSGFSLSEIEGDAVLFYKKGDLLSKQVLVKQCIDIFSKFHEALKFMERDVVCRCGACQTASDLTLKFIIHYGVIKEFRIANIVKASGVDMIIAHRLLKNNINSKEYILFSSACLDCMPDKEDAAGLKWNTRIEKYPAIGDIKLQFADLEELKKNLPPIPERKSYVSHKEGDVLEVEIDAPLKEVYQKLIDLDLITKWMVGVTGIKRDPLVERIGTKHICISPQFEMEVELADAEFKEDSAYIVNKISIREIGVKGIGKDYLKKIDDNRTLLRSTNEFDLPGDLKQEMLAELKLSLDQFKALCEGREVEAGIRV